MGLAECFKEGYNISSRYTGVTVVEDLPPINIYFWWYLCYI